MLTQIYILNDVSESVLNASVLIEIYIKMRTNAFINLNNMIIFLIIVFDNKSKKCLMI